MMSLKVFKFGGASVKDAAAIENLHGILRRYPDDRLVVVISAMGKTTNFLEKVLHAYYHDHDQVEALVSELEMLLAVVLRPALAARSPVYEVFNPKNCDGISFSYLSTPTC